MPTQQEVASKPFCAIWNHPQSAPQLWNKSTKNDNNNKNSNHSHEESDGQINFLLYVQVMIKESGFDAICLVSSQN